MSILKILLNLDIPHSEIRRRQETIFHLGQVHHIELLHSLMKVPLKGQRVCTI